MAWWGKVVGGAFGFMLGGPLGALLGAALGHKVDAGKGRTRRFLPGDQERTQAAFFAATFSVMGHLAKVDGQVSKDEIRLAEEIMSHMQLDKVQRKFAIALFNQGKSPDFNLDDILHQFRNECHRRTTLIQIFLEIQVQAAFADGTLHAQEKRLLQQIAGSLGFAADDLERIINFVRAGNAAHAPDRSLSLNDAYRILGVDAGTPLAEVKKAYRRLLSQHHPDKLVSKGLPEEMIRLANEKTHEIREAWKRVQESR